MKKMMITESQLRRIKKNLMEQSDDNRYEIDVKCFIGGFRLKYNGKEIDNIGMLDSDVSSHDGFLRLTYIIEFEKRTWGIKDVMIYNIQGPEEIELDIDIDGDTSVVKLPLVWDNIRIEKRDSDGMISLGELEIVLMNDENGQIVVEELIIEVYQ